jgi:hypothetical protein
LVKAGLLNNKGVLKIAFGVHNSTTKSPHGSDGSNAIREQAMIRYFTKHLKKLP